jgi:hypothetical protein
MEHQHLGVGQDVNFVDANGKTVKGKISEVYGDDAARIDVPGGTAVAIYSDGKEPGTFHFSENKAAETASAKAASK